MQKINSIVTNKYFGYIMLFVTAGTVILSLNYFQKINEEQRQPRVLPAVTRDDSVNVSGTIYGCILNLRVYPEFRTAGNYQTDLDVEIYSSGNTFEGDFTTTTDANGDATVDVCAEGINLIAGTYDFYIKGLSHLRFNFDGYAGFTTAETTINFAASGDRLIAGETSVIYDNVINTLDVSTQINNYLSANDVNDLNQDGIVNNLDIDWTIQNYLLEGDCSPEEVANSICN